MLLDINSNDLTNTSGVYYLNKNYPLTKTDKDFIIHKIQVPQSFYTIIGKTIKVNSTTVTITDGVYNISDLCSTMQSLIRTAMSDTSYVVSYNSNTLYVTISASTTHTLDFTPVSSIASYIGFLPTLLTTNTTHTGTLAYNPYGDQMIGFCCDWLDKYTEKYNTSTIKSLVTRLPVKKNPDYYVTYEPHYIIKYLSWLSLKSDFGNCSFWFVNQQGTVLDFKGVPWFMTLEIS